MNLWIALAVIAVFILVPVVVMGRLGVFMVDKTLKTLAVVALKIGVLAALVYWLMQWDNFLLDCLFLLVLLFYAAMEVKMKARLRSTSYVWAVIGGLLAGTLLTGVGILLVYIMSLAAFSTRFVVPVFAVLIAGTADVLARSLAMYYAGLRNHSQLYYYMLGNGATRSEALGYLMRRAVKQAAVRGIKGIASVATMGVGALTMWAMIMGGASTVEAVAMLVMLVTGVFCSSVVATVVAVAMARRYALDAYGRMKDSK